HLGPRPSLRDGGATRLSAPATATLRASAVFSPMMSGRRVAPPNSGVGRPHEAGERRDACRRLALRPIYARMPPCPTVQPCAASQTKAEVAWLRARKAA